ncbi:MAG: hypothetical protein ABW098_18375 [Candidatus Thiodiazotropha sp.]
MKSLITITSLLLFLCLVPPLSAEENTVQEQTGQSSATTSKHKKHYSSQSLNPTQFSRKCGIYSGVCPMNRRVKVGDYCICHTPSGPIHGVVIP